ncbi:putative mitochondrial hypothetical protein [Leptomonas pyrrhocoris]|uniref:Cytochrome b5 heme-binding domain-containing protein n=1 Tax=Leptomonas pyrrhocoris TaxID=157538 RepID=A0A0M9FP95_LEPPY|nr:putative mitochondrial hypothetical protein [Leptomonas pyrrhocoris]KPA73285.1 putative mitochondrial hypothetical protein [Leptomonas pyrrhocoris]|eukprot:XP_015651724.1 putative mitochondrial hypothetical protein [Leptomonas pyrrhocoris]
MASLLVTEGGEVNTMAIVVGVVVGLIATLLLRLQLRSRERLTEKPRANLFVPRAYTVEELAEYDGKTKPEAFVGVKGVIYNASLDWYGPEGPYNAFAGCDSSRQLGKVVVSRDEINADWTTLAPSHLQTLHEWEERLRSKYPAVGWITDPNGDFVKRAASMQP